MSARGQFSNKLGFIAAAAGSAIGLGNIWKFPFEVGRGGGAAFVAMYLLFCFILCFPVLVTEIAIGRKTSRNPAGAFKALGFPKWASIGKIYVLCGVLILSFYNVVAGWTFGYFVEMIMGNFEIGNQFHDFTKDIIKTGLYAIIFIAATAFIVSKGIAGGLEKAAKILMPTLLVLLVGLMIYAMTLKNAEKGLAFYLIPDFSKINLKVIYGALGQAFFSLSLGMGALITYGSYLSRKENIISSAAIITLCDVGIAFIAGLMLFPFIFSQGIEPNGGPGLIFVTLPGVFENLGPTLGQVVGSVFFLLLAFSALTSTISLLEVPVSYAVDEHKAPRKTAVWVIAGIIFILGIPSMLGHGYSEFFSKFITYPNHDDATSFMDFIGHIANDSFLPLGGCITSIFAAYIWKKENLNAELSEGFPNYSQSFAAKYIYFALRFLCPIILGTIFILTVLNRFFGIDFFGS